MIGVCDNMGAVQERYGYSPYGVVTFYDPSWTVRSSSAYVWAYLFQSGRWETLTGLYNFRNRDDSPMLGRWMQVDPMGLGLYTRSLYLYLEDCTTTLLDPDGLHIIPPGMNRKLADRLYFKCRSYINRGKKQRAGKQPDPLTVEQNNCCKKEADFLTNLPPNFRGPLSPCHSKVIGLLAAIKNAGCKKPGVLCESCFGYGWWDANSNAVHICYNNTKGEDFCGTIYHELVHAYQTCTGWTTKTCLDSLEKEFQAYYCDGSCNGLNFDDCLLRVLASSCSAWCEAQRCWMFTRRF